MYPRASCWRFMEGSAACGAESDSSCPSAQCSGKGTFARIVMDTMIMVSIFILILAENAAVLFGLMILGAAGKMILALAQQEKRPKEQPLAII